MATKAKIAAAAAPAVPEKSKLFRVLSSVVLINSEEFAKQTPKKQADVFLACEGKPPKFVSSFFDLQNPVVLRDALLSGRDVSLELEFNEIELSAEEMSALKAVKPILAKIAEIGPLYPWLTAEDHNANITFNTDTIRRNNYTITHTVAKAIWAKASEYWSGGKRPAETYQTSGFKYLRFEKTMVSIGCQNITRGEVEFIARTLGWAPTVHVAK